MISNAFLGSANGNARLPVAEQTRVAMGRTITTDVQGVAIPVIVGTARVPGTELDGNCRFSPGVPGQSWMAYGFCEGLIDSIGNLFFGECVESIPYTDGTNHISGDVMMGGIGQGAMPYLVSNYPSNALPYSGICYLVNVQYGLATFDQPNPPYPKGTPVSVEIQRGAWNAGGGIVDAHPDDIIQFWLKDPVSGIGFPATKLAMGSGTSFYDYCAAAGLFFSPVLSSRQPLADSLQTILSTANSEFVWCDDALSVVPYGESSITGNGHTYTPNLTPVYALGPDDFITEDTGSSTADEGMIPTSGNWLPAGAPTEEPIIQTRVAVADRYTKIPIEFNDRQNAYGSTTIYATADAQAAAYGVRVADTIKANHVCLQSIAVNVVSLALLRQSYLPAQHQFKLGWKHALLAPTDIVSLTEPNQGYTARLVRILSIEEDGGALSITAEDVILGACTPMSFSADRSNPTPASPLNPNVTSVADAQKQAMGFDSNIWYATLGGTLHADHKMMITYTYNSIINEQSAIDTQATALSITTEKTAYDTSVSALIEYMATLTTPTYWADLSGDTTGVGLMMANFDAVFATRQTLLLKIFNSYGSAVVPTETAISAVSDAAAAAQADAAQALAGNSSTAVGDGVTNSFQFVGPSITRTDWQGGTRTNAILQSQSFNVSPWIAQQVTVAANSILAPDGTMTADTLIENSAASIQHRLDQATVNNAGVLVFSVHAKATASPRALYLRIGAGGVGFNVQTGVALSGDAGYTGSVIALPNGWYRLVVTKAAGNANETCRINLYDGSTIVYNGDGVSGCYIWGAQLDLGALTNYIPTIASAVTVYDGSPTPLYSTTRTNLALRSQEYDNSAWTKVYVTVTPNNLIAPDGSATMDTLLGSNAITSYVQQNTNVLAATNYVESVYVCAGTSLMSIIKIFNSSTTTTIAQTSITWTAGVPTLGAGGPGYVASEIEPLGNGIYRILLTFNTGANTTIARLLYPSNTNLATSIGAWGSHCALASEGQSYIPTTTAPVSVTDYTVAGGLATLAPAPLQGAILRGVTSNAGAVAAGAQTSAASANAEIANIVSDNVLSTGEKGAVIRDYNVIISEQSGIVAQANAYGVSHSTYDAAISTLTSYLGGLSPAYTNVTPGQDTVIVGTTFRTNFTNVYSARQTLLNAVYAAAQALANAAQGTANTAITNAATAQATANTAATNAASALTQLTNIASDNILSPSEKPPVVQDYAVIIGERTGIDAQATTFSITTEKTDYDSAVSALTTYLGTLTGWNTIPGSDVAIVGTTFRSNFQNVYTTRQTLLNAIYTKAKALADAAQTTGNTGVANAATALAAANAAQVDATTSLNALADIASDSLLTPGEKPVVIKDRDTITNEQAGIDAQATAYSITTTKTTYDNAVTALTTYLATLTTPVLWSTLTGNTTIVGATFRSKFTDVYTARQAVLNAIYAAAKVLADAAQGGVNQINSVDYLTNSDKIQLMMEWASELATQTSLDAQATALSITTEKTAYDNAITAISAGLIAVGAPAGWATSWPDGTISGPWTGILTSLKTWWGTIGSTRTALQNKISTAAATAAALPALALAPAIVANHTAITLPDAANYPAKKMVFQTVDNTLWQVNAAGTGWLTPSMQTSGLIGTVSDAQIAGMAASKVTGTLTDSQLAAIAAAKITGTLTDAQLSAIAASKVTGTLTDSQLAAIAATKVTGQIVTTQITDNSITTAKINAGAVTASQIAADTITAAQIAANAVTSSELAAGAVIAGKITAGTIVAADIAASTITGAKIAANTITAANIAADTITATEIAASAITSSEIAAGAVIAGKITAGTIVAADIAASTITGAKIAAGTITGDNLVANTITAGQIAAGAIGVDALAASLAIVGTIQSGGTGGVYTAGTPTVPATGYKISGVPFNVYYLGDSTPHLVMCEFGGDLSIAGYKASTMVDFVFNSLVTNGDFSGGSYSTTGGMYGRGVYITPKATGRVSILIAGTISSNSAGTDMSTFVQYGTGTMPAAGAATAGLNACPAKKCCSTPAYSQLGFCRTTVITGLTIGTRYWFDLGVGSNGTATITIRDGVDIVAMEV